MRVPRSNGFACLVVLVAYFALVSSAHAQGKCELGKVAELPITMAGLRPLITAQVNG